MTKGSEMIIGMLALGGLDQNGMDLFFAFLTSSIGEFFFVGPPVPLGDCAKNYLYSLTYLVFI